MRERYVITRGKDFRLGSLRKTRDVDQPHYYIEVVSSRPALLTCGRDEMSAGGTWLRERDFEKLIGVI